MRYLVLVLVLLFACAPETVDSDVESNQDTLVSKDAGVCICVAEPVELPSCPNSNARKTYGFCHWGILTGSAKEGALTCFTAGAKFCDAGELHMVIALSDEVVEGNIADCCMP